MSSLDLHARLPGVILTLINWWETEGSLSKAAICSKLDVTPIETSNALSITYLTRKMYLNTRLLPFTIEKLEMIGDPWVYPLFVFYLFFLLFPDLSKDENSFIKFISNIRSQLYFSLFGLLKYHVSTYRARIFFLTFPRTKIVYQIYLKYQKQLNFSLSIKRPYIDVSRYNLAGYLTLGCTEIW